MSEQITHYVWTLDWAVITALFGIFSSFFFLYLSLKSDNLEMQFESENIMTRVDSSSKKVSYLDKLLQSSDPKINLCSTSRVESAILECTPAERASKNKKKKNKRKHVESTVNNETHSIPETTVNNETQIIPEPNVEVSEFTKSINNYFNLLNTIENEDIRRYRHIEYCFNIINYIMACLNINMPLISIQYDIEQNHNFDEKIKVQSCHTPRSKFVQILPKNLLLSMFDSTILSQDEFSQCLNILNTEMLYIIQKTQTVSETV
jgi:hypothetical protein